MAVHYSKLNKGAEKGVRICNAVYLERAGYNHFAINTSSLKKRNSLKVDYSEQKLPT